jgi:HK97 gp10 family phage protein
MGRSSSSGRAVVTGDRELIREFKRLGDVAARRAALAAVQAGAELVADEARALAPVDTGRLRDSIRTLPPVVRGGSVVVAVAAGGGSGSGVDYAAMVEYGTSHAPPHPFMAPAELRAGPAVKSLVAARIQIGIETGAKL